MITPLHFLVLSAILFSIGVAGILIRRNLIVILMSIEIMLNATNLLFVGFSRMQANHDGQIATFFTIALAAAEAAIGLAIVIAIFRNRATVQVDQV